VGSLKLDGIRFVVYSNDHPPRHVHGFLGETEVIVDLRADGIVRWRNAGTLFVRRMQSGRM
jgi:hypothetical protein